MTTKFCKRCGVDTERYSSGTCKPCHTKYQTNHREKRLVRMVKWHINNPEKDAAARKAIYRKNNPEKSAAANKKWRADNPEKTSVIRRNRRAAMAAAPGSHTAEDICAIATYQNNQCACCATSIEGGYHVDHIKALSRGGSNDRSNLQLLCSPCNLRKHAKNPVEFMQKFFQERVKEWAAALLNRREVLGF